MITDAFLRLAGTSANPPVAGAITNLASGTTSTSNFFVDLASNVPTSGTNPNSNGLQYRDIGEGYPLHAVVTLVTAASGTSVSMTFNVIVADDEAGTTNPVIIGTTGVILAANLTVGKQFVIELNPQLATPGQRYLMGQYVNGAAIFVGGTHFFDIVLDYADSKKFYASGFAVS